MASVSKLYRLYGAIGTCLVSINVHAEATAVARVSARIVPAVTASLVFPQTQNVAAGHYSFQPVASSGTVDTKTGSNGITANIAVSSPLQLSYVMTIAATELSSTQDVADFDVHSAETIIMRDFVTSNVSRTLQVDKSLNITNNASAGSYKGSLFITANFN